MLWLLVEWDDLRLSIIPAGWLKEPLIPANSSAVSGLKVPFMGLSYWGKKAGKLYKVKVLEMNGKSVRRVINLSCYFTLRPYTESKPILEKRLKEEMREGKQEEARGEEASEEETSAAASSTQPFLNREAVESRKQKQTKKRAATVHYNEDIWLKRKISGKCIVINGHAAS